MSEQIVTKDVLRSAAHALMSRSIKYGMASVVDGPEGDRADSAYKHLLRLIESLPIPATMAEAELKSEEMAALNRYLEDHHHRKLLWMNDARQPVPEPIYWPHPDWWPVDAPAQVGPDPQGDNF